MCNAMDSSNQGTLHIQQGHWGYCVHLPRALQNRGSGPPESLPAHDVSGDVHLGIDEAPLLQDPGSQVVVVNLDGGTLLGPELGFDGGNLLHRHRV